MNKPIERIRIAGAALALSAGVLVAAPAQASGSVFGAVIGGGAGAVIGQSIAGRDGAIIGGALGAAAGAAAASDHAYRRHDGYGGYGSHGGYGGGVVVYPAPVYRVPPRVVYEARPHVVYRPVYVAPQPVYYGRPGRPRWHDRHDYRHRGPVYGY